jgi:hypothetical protein
MAKGHQVKKGLLLNDLNHDLWRFCMLDLVTLLYSMNLNTCYVTKWLCCKGRETKTMCNQVEHIDHVYKSFYMSSLYGNPSRT